MTEADEHHLRRAIALASAARAAGDMPYGSLLVGPAGDVLTDDRNTVVSGRDITAHPELKLARWAARQLGPELARQTTMYTSCQPCPMCTGAIARSGLGRVVFALSSEQLHELKPPGAVSPDAAQVAYEGPALHADARVPIDGYYSESRGLRPGSSTWTSHCRQQQRLLATASTTPNITNTGRLALVASAIADPYRDRLGARRSSIRTGASPAAAWATAVV